MLFFFCIRTFFVENKLFIILLPSTICFVFQLIICRSLNLSINEVVPFWALCEIFISELKISLLLITDYDIDFSSKIPKYDYRFLSLFGKHYVFHVILQQLLRQNFAEISNQIAQFSHCRDRQEASLLLKNLSFLKYMLTASKLPLQI